VRGYVLGRTLEEYERLSSQARVWEAATGRLLDQVESRPAHAAWTRAADPARRCG
jgi:hypothetical protein